MCDTNSRYFNTICKSRQFFQDVKKDLNTLEKYRKDSDKIFCKIKDSQNYIEHQLNIIFSINKNLIKRLEEVGFSCLRCRESITCVDFDCFSSDSSSKSSCVVFCDVSNAHSWITMNQDRF